MALTDQLSFSLEFENNGDDATANNLDFTGINTPTFSTGITGDATQLDGAFNQYWTRATHALLQPGPAFTFEIWAYWDVTAPTLLFAKDGISSDRSFALYMDASLNFVTAYVFDASGGVTTAVSMAFGTDIWYQFVMTYDPADQKVRLIVNDGTPSVSAALALGINTGSTAPVEIGDRASFPAPHYGKIDMARFWQRVLSAGEITQLFNSNNGMSYADMTSVADFVYPKIAMAY